MQTKTFKMTEELASTLENFQQACVAFTGPYNDAHDRLCKLAYRPGAEITKADLDWVRELTEDLLSQAESLEVEMQDALQDFDMEVEEIEEDDED